MGIKGNRKRLIAATIAVAGIAGGAVAVQAATFSERKLGTSTTPEFSTIPMTQCAADVDNDASTCDLYVYAGFDTVTVQNVNATVPGPQSVRVLGFRVSNAPIADMSTVGLAGSDVSTIKVTEGTKLAIHFSQDSRLADPVSLSFPSLAIPSGTLTFTANKVGTSVFQPGDNLEAPRQIAMGLVGALIVSPTGCDTCAYAGGTPGNEEVVVATTDLDPEFADDFFAHQADPQNRQFSMGYFGQSPAPDGSQRPVYHLINGKAYPDTKIIDVHVLDNLLIRSVNAGVTDKSMGLLGVRQTLLGRNASKYTDPQTLIAPLVGPGETADILVTVPSSAVAGQMYSLMDQGRQMNHGTVEGFGGALTFIQVWPAAVPTPLAVQSLDGDTTTTAGDTTTSEVTTTTTGDTTTTTGDTTTTEGDTTTTADGTTTTTGA